MVGADHPPVAGRRPARQQLVPAVAAHVGEGPQDPVLAPGQEHPGRAQRLSPLVPRLGQVLAAADTHPLAVEEVALLPGEHRVVHIGGPGQHAALPERQE